MPPTTHRARRSLCTRSTRPHAPFRGSSSPSWRTFNRRMEVWWCQRCCAPTWAACPSSRRQSQNTDQLALVRSRRSGGSVLVSEVLPLDSDYISNSRNRDISCIFDSGSICDVVQFCPSAITCLCVTLTVGACCCLCCSAIYYLISYWKSASTAVVQALSWASKPGIEIDLDHYLPPLTHKPIGPK